MSLQVMPCSRLCTLMVHTQSHCPDDLILNCDIFHDYEVGEIVQIYDTERVNDRLILKVLTMPSTSGRLEISLSKLVAESLSFKPFSKVIVEKISEEQASINFVEFVFKRQYLQRGNMWRFKSSMFGKPVHTGQNLSINGMQAQIVQLRNKVGPTMSGIINEKTKFVFRSRSSRIIWLVQISAEMWEFDQLYKQNGTLYFEKFLSDFVSPILDSWKALGVSHMLTVVFFARTFYLERINASNQPELHGKKSLGQTTDGLQYQDFYRIVLENIADIDKVAHIKKLRQEFWAFPKVVGWTIAPKAGPNSNAHSDVSSTPSKNQASAARDQSPSGSSSSPESVDNVDLGNLQALNMDDNLSQPKTAPISGNSNSVNYAVPSDAVHGNFLESINTSLNILDKHFMDRDLTRTGNAIVMISAGSGIFKVKPNLAQITKQRMVDGGIGLDFISLSKPSVHVVPLFLVDCRSEPGMKDFYEMPYWIKLSYIDCKREISDNLDSTSEQCGKDKDKAAIKDLTLSEDAIWAQGFSAQPLSSLLTAQLVNSADLKTLAKSYARTLPLPLRHLLLHDENCFVGSQKCGGEKSSVSRESSIRTLLDTSVSSETTTVSHVSGVNDIPTWGAVPPNFQSNADGTSLDRKHQPKPLSVNNTLPILKRDRAESSVAESLSSMYLDEDLMGDFHRRHSGTALSQGSRNLSKESLRYSFGDENEKMADDFEYHKATNRRPSSGSLSSSAEQNNQISISVASDSTDSQSVSHLRLADEHMQSNSSFPQLVRRNSNANMQNSEAATEQFDLLCEISTLSLTKVNRDKLLELMNKHDQNVFKSAAKTATPASSSTPTTSLVPLVSIASLSYSDDGSSKKRLDEKPTPVLVGDHAGKAEKVEAVPTLKLQIPDGEQSQSQSQSVQSSSRQSVGTAKLSPRSAALIARSNQGFDRRKMMMGGGPGRGIAPQNKVTSGGSSTGNFEQLNAAVEKPHGILRGVSNENGSKPARLSSKNFVSKSQFVTSFHPNTPHTHTNHTTRVHEARPGMSSAAGAVNQGWMVQHGKIIPIVASKPGEDKSQYIREYCNVTCINPFRPKEGLNYLQSITHNRRRWSHVFPQGAFERYLGHQDYGLNWKSLTQPAILPLSTDYMPNVQALSKGYDVQNFYQLVLDRNECPFLTPEILMQEMISQRLSREFQLIEGVDLEPFIQFNKNNSTAGPGTRTVVSSLLTRRSEKAAAATASEQATKKKTFFILSMGHRIQFLDYDAAADQVNVTQFRSKKGQNNEDDTNTHTYNYELWVPATNRFQTMTQTFYQFPNPELKWNKIDNIIVGNLPFDAVDDGTKARRLRFTILPESIATETQIDEYFSKIDQLFEFLGKYCSSNEVVSIKKERGVLELSETESLVDCLMATAYSDPVIATPATNAATPQTSAKSTGAFSATGLHGPPSRGPSSKQSQLGISTISRGNSGDIMTSSGPAALSPNLLSKAISTASNVNAQSFPSPAGPSTINSVGIAAPSSPSSAAAGSINLFPSRTNSSSALLPGEPLLSATLCPSVKLAAVNKNAPVNSSISLYQKASTHSEILKLNMKGVSKDNPNWLFFKHEKHIYTYKACHIEFHWLVCDSWLIDEFITLLFRRCNKWGLRLCQTPEYFSTPNLNVHPFRAQPHIVVPTIENVPAVHCSPIRLIERLYFRRSTGWIFDTEQKTDWSSLGLPVPDYAVRDRDIYNDVSAEVKPPIIPVVAPSKPVISSLSKSFQKLMGGGDKSGVADDQAHNASVSVKPASRSSLLQSPGAPAPRQWGSRGANYKDRQYIHHMGLATVRVAAQGFVWLNNASARVSDVNSSADEKRDLMMRKMTELDRFCRAATDCYEVLLDVISAAMDVVSEKEKEAERAAAALEIEKSASVDCEEKKDSIAALPTSNTESLHNSTTTVI